MYNLKSFDCSRHELQWFLLSCTRTSLVPKKKDQQSNFFSCKYAFNKAKLNAAFSPLSSLTSNIKISLNCSTQLRNFRSKRHGSFCNANTSSCNTCSYICQVFIKLVKLFNQFFSAFLFLEACPVKTLPSAQQE